MPDTPSIPKSRSQKKRESTALQRLGEELTRLPVGALEKLALPRELAEAVTAWRSLASHEARRRQMQYIGRCMRELDRPEEVRAAVERLHSGSREDTALLHRVEELRAALLAPVPELREQMLEQVLQDLPGLERGTLTHLVAAALAEREKQRPPKAFRELFRLLKNACQGG